MVSRDRLPPQEGSSQRSLERLSLGTPEPVANAGVRVVERLVERDGSVRLLEDRLTVEGQPAVSPRTLQTAMPPQPDVQNERESQRAEDEGQRVGTVEAEVPCAQEPERRVDALEDEIRQAHR